MRIWDRIDPAALCTQHLLGEHRELHGLFNIVNEGKKGYSNHPETKRWVGRLAALKLRHDALVDEMHDRGYQHRSDLPEVSDSPEMPETIDDQVEALRRKRCLCKTTGICSN